MRLLLIVSGIRVKTALDSFLSVQVYECVVATHGCFTLSLCVCLSMCFCQFCFPVRPNDFLCCETSHHLA